MANLPIEELLRQYAEDGCKFGDINYVVNTSLRYTDSMPDSQVRCLLYILAREVTKLREIQDILDKPT